MVARTSCCSKPDSIQEQLDLMLTFTDLCRRVILRMDHHLRLTH